MGATVRTEPANNGPRISEAPSDTASRAAAAAPSGVPLVSWTSNSKLWSEKSNNASCAAFNSALPTCALFPVNGSNIATRAGDSGGKATSDGGLTGVVGTGSGETVGVESAGCSRRAGGGGRTMSCGGGVSTACLSSRSGEDWQPARANITAATSGVTR